MSGLYIHIPFCKTRCSYCDFFTQTNLKEIDEYVDVLCSEIVLRKDFFEKKELQTIYFGGGTPSLLNVTHLQKIFDVIFEHFSILPDPEITLEANPDDLNKNYLKALRTTPVNRLSIGIQTFDDNELKSINRRHSGSDAIAAVELSQEVGYNNLSLDLIYGLPSQSLEKWIQNLNQAIDLSPSHISAYHLIYEENTPLYKSLKKGIINEVNEEVSLSMFSELINKLKKAGYEHYEISNFAKNKLYSKHNSSYWSDTPYLGIGVSAHSYNGVNRYFNLPSLTQYVSEIKNKKLHLEVENLTVKDKYNEFILTGLRTMWGIDMSVLSDKFGALFYDYCIRNITEYLVSDHLYLTDGRLHLSEKGIFISDKIMSDLMFVQDDERK